MHAASGLQRAQRWRKPTPGFWAAEAHGMQSHRCVPVRARWLPECGPFAQPDSLRGIVCDERLLDYVDQHLVYF